MQHSIRTRLAGSLSLCLLLTTLVAGPASAGRAPAPMGTPAATSVDLGPTLTADGTFVGAPGVAGTVDTSAWALVSNLSAGEAPRFVRATATTTVATATPEAWSALGDNQNGTGTSGALNNSVFALAVSGSELYVGGLFFDAAGIATADNVARWDGSAWSALGDNLNGTGSNGALNGPVNALAVSGSNLYVGGSFYDAAGIARADHVARWDGSAWSPLGSTAALSYYVYALAVMGGELYVGGNFTNAANIAKADYVARWDGSNWSALGSNVAGTDGALNNTVRALAVSGSDLYVGGNFTGAAGIATADKIARWDGSNWSALGDNQNGTGTDGALSDIVRALAVSGSDLYVGGNFTNAAGIAKADYLARWDGSVWSALGDNQNGTGTDGALNNVVWAVAVSGSDLYVGGWFDNVAGIATADKIARWDGSAWSALGDNQNGSGSNGALNASVLALAESSSVVYVGGGFGNAAGLAKADYVARWVTPSVPSAPQTPSATPGNAQATVSWSAPSSNGGSPITSYTVTSSPGAKTCAWSNGPLSCTVTDLTNGVAYTFSVVASNAAGPGPASTASAAVTPTAGTGRQPDGRIKLGTGAYIGNNIYNLTGLNQTKIGSKARGYTVTFGISIQNDSATTADRFKTAATGMASTMYTVTYWHGLTNITAAVVAGTFTTPSLAPGATYLIKAKVKVLKTATIGSSVSRLVTITSVADGTKQDVVGFTGKRK